MREYEKREIKVQKLCISVGGNTRNREENRENTRGNRTGRLATGNKC
jgi:hypothetical protein